MCLLIVMPFYCAFLRSPRRLMNSSRSSSIFDSIFSRYFSLLSILVSSAIVVVAAVYGLTAIDIAFPFIMSSRMSCCSRDTGYYVATLPV